MAMSMRSQGLASSTTGRPRLSVLPVYEDFRPFIESKEDPDSHAVYIYLPGFLKEQIRIVAESTKRLLRVRGEHLIAGNRRSRFQEEVPVPANCAITETRAKFEGGVLRITMPKRISSVVSPSPSPTALSDEATTPERSPPPPRRPAPPPPPRPVAHPQPHPAPAAPRQVSPPPRTAVAVPTLVPLPPPRTMEVPPRPVTIPPQRTPAAEIPTALPPPKPTEPRVTPNFQPKPRDDAKSKQSTPLPPLPTPLPPPPQIAPIIQQRPREDEKHNFEVNQKPLPLAPPTAAAAILQALPQSDPAPWRDPIDTERWRSEARFTALPQSDPAPWRDPINEERWRTEAKFPALRQSDPAPWRDPINEERRRTEAKFPALPQSDPAPWRDPIDVGKWRTEARFPARPEEPLKSAAPMTVAGTLKAYELMKEEEVKAGSGGRRRMEKDGQLLVNMGVAVMVMVGFGAWISYSFGIGSPPNSGN